MTSPNSSDKFLPESEVKSILGRPVGPPRRATLIVRNIGQLVTLRGPARRVGSAMGELGILTDAGIAVAGDTVLAIGASDSIEGKVDIAPSCVLLDALGGLVTPGFVDSHTHPVFNMTREKEFEMRLGGKTYMEIGAAGGGIRASVRDLRASSEETVRSKLRQRLDRMLRHGTTTVEAKSGYGLSVESELLSLEAIRYWQERHPLELAPTFLGAHEVPDEFRGKKSDYVKLLLNEMLPQVADRNLARFCDVFCEEGVFGIDDTQRILEAAKKLGLGLKLHADEIKTTGGAELAARLGATSADHLMAISDAGIAALASSRTVATLLPGTSYSLGANKFAPARKLIESGAVVAIATDCNPGSNYCESMAMSISLACVHYRMTPAEALTAATVNGAAALGMADQRGQLDLGRLADFLVWDADDYREIPYHYGVNLVRHVVKAGKLVADNSSGKQIVAG